MDMLCADCGGVPPGVTTNLAGARPCTCQRVVASGSYVSFACSRCGQVVNNVSPGYSIVGSKVVCARCLAPSDRETARARTLDLSAAPALSDCERIEALEVLVRDLSNRVWFLEDEARRGRTP
jgi:hypothetical protein